MHINYATSSGRKTASVQVSTQPSALCGIDVVSPSTGVANLIVWDSENSTTTGKTIIAEVEADAGLVSVNHEYFVPVHANRGIYIELVQTGGSDATYNIRYFLA